MAYSFSWLSFGVNLFLTYTMICIFHERTSKLLLCLLHLCKVSSIRWNKFYSERNRNFSTIASSLYSCYLFPCSILYIVCGLLDFILVPSFSLTWVVIYSHLWGLLPSKPDVWILVIFKYLLHSLDINILCQIWRI